MNNDIPPILKTPNPLIIRYDLDRWDLFRVNLRAILHNRFVVIFSLAIAIGAGLLTTSSADFAERSLAFKIFVFLFEVFVLLLLMSIVQLVFLALMCGFKKYPGILCEHELEIRDDGLIERTSVNESLHRWAGFHKVVSTRSYLYIYVTTVMIHIVPKGYFTCEQEAQSFRREIEKRIKAL